MAKVQVGKAVPDFTIEATGGKPVGLRSLAGRNVVLYFYPKDDTPGCTKEACSFRDKFAAFKKKGAVVLGVSIDPVKSHAKAARGPPGSAGASPPRPRSHRGRMSSATAGPGDSQT